MTKKIWIWVVIVVIVFIAVAIVSITVGSVLETVVGPPNPVLVVHETYIGFLNANDKIIIDGMSFATEEDGTIVFPVETSKCRTGFGLGERMFFFVECRYPEQIRFYWEENGGYKVTRTEVIR